MPMNIWHLSLIGQIIISFSSLRKSVRWSILQKNVFFMFKCFAKRNILQYAAFPCLDHYVTKGWTFLNFFATEFVFLAVAVRHHRKSKVWGRHSTEVAFALLTQLYWVRFSVFPKFILWIYSGCCWDLLTALLRTVDSGLILLIEPV